MAIRHGVIAALGICSAFCPGLAWAQDKEPRPEASTGERDIIVTGEKAERPLQQTPTSVRVITRSEIEDQGLLSAQDLYTRVAGLADVYGGKSFNIRGLANIGVTGAGDAQLATIYMDGAPLVWTSLHAAPTDLWDVARVEILRGPQSTLQGLNALAGAIIIRTVDPTFDWQASGRALVNNSGDYRVAFAGGGPIQTDQLAFRIAAEQRGRNGFIRNTTRNDDEDEASSLNLRGKLLWTPDALPDLKARLSTAYFRQNGGYYFVYSRTDQPDYLHNRIATDNTPNITNVRMWSSNLELDYRLSGVLTASSNSNWSRVSEFDQFDEDGGPTNASFGAQTRHYSTITQEFRLNADRPNWQGVLGAFYYDRHLKSNLSSRTDVPTPVSTIAALLQGGGLNAPTAITIANAYATALPVVPVDYQAALPSKVQTMAFFGDGRWTLAGRFSVLAGFRYDRETNSSPVTQSSVFAGTLPDPTAFGPFGPAFALINSQVGGFVAQTNATILATPRTFKVFLPKLGIKMDWSPDLSTAFVVQRGYRSGGSSNNIARGQSFAYDPEFTWNYEASIRSQWLDGRLRIDANAYYTSWKNQQVTVNFGLNSFDSNTVNAGRSHFYGVELEATHRVNQLWDWYAAVSYNRTEFDQFDTNIGGTVSDLAGTEFAYAPHWILAAGANIRPAARLSANVNANFRSHAFGVVGLNQTLFPVHAQTLVNTKISYQLAAFTLFAFANNIFDDVIVQYKPISQARALISDPRTFGIGIETRL